MTSPWKNVAASTPTDTMNFAEIMSEEYAQRVHKKEVKRYEEMVERQKREEAQLTKQQVAQEIWENTSGSSNSAGPSSSTAAMTYSEAAQVTEKQKNEEWEDCSALLYDENNMKPTEKEDVKKDVCLSDEVIAQMLQSQFDHEYNEELRRIERQRNKQSKVTVTLNKFHRNGDLEFAQQPEEEEEADDEACEKRDWDRFETNEKIWETIPKCGFKVGKEGGVVTKHDPHLCGVRNACRVMSFPPEFPTGDGAGFEMKLSNQVYNQLKTYSHRGVKRPKMQDRKENVSTAEMGVDAPTRLLLYKLINNQILEQINGIISTGKESVILHANSDAAYSGGNDSSGHGKGGVVMAPNLLPKECAIKIFKTTLNDFKQRDRYIKDDYRFKDRISKQNHRVIINMWAEKEMHNMMRMQSVGINCPDVVVLKKHVLVMSFIGDNHNAAPKLKHANLSETELSSAYEEIVEAMHKLYNEAKLVHADLSEYNILWYDGKCWFIDMAQSVEPEHPSALEFLMRDCTNIINFFTKRGLPNIYTKEQLFEHITSLNPQTHNVAMLERIHTRGASIKEATAPEQDCCPDELKPLVFPFDLAWKKSQAERENQHKSSLDKATNAMQVLSTKCNVEAATIEQSIEKKSSTVTAVNTAEN